MDKTRDRDELHQRLELLLGTFKDLPEDNQQKLVTWMVNVVGRKLPKDDPVLQQLIQSAKGEIPPMGLEKVLDDIENKGRLEGRIEGVELAKQTMARQLLAKQMDTAFIAEVTGFTPEAIKRLAQANR